MGFVEINDGIATRRIEVPELSGTVRVEAGGDEVTVLVPDEADVDRAEVVGEYDRVGPYP